MTGLSKECLRLGIFGMHLDPVLDYISKGAVMNYWEALYLSKQPDIYTNILASNVLLARVLYGLIHSLEQDSLLRVGLLDLRGGHGEEAGVKGTDINVEEVTFLGLDGPGLSGQVVETIRIPAVARHRDHTLSLVHQELPELVGVMASTGQSHPHADDSDRDSSTSGLSG